MKILAIIPARKGSKGLKNKNIKNFCGKPLICWTILSALNCKLIDKIIVSTDSVEIKKISEKYNIEKNELRPKSLSDDNSPTHNVIVYEWEKQKKKKYNPEIVVTLQPTSPLRDSKHITYALKKLIANKNSDSLVSCVKVPHNFVPESLMQIKNDFLINTEHSKKIFNRNEKPIYFARNGAAIYATKERILKKCLYNENTIPFEMKFSESIDIDDENDLEIASLLFKQKINYEKSD